MRTLGRIMAVVSQKGGVGKTTLTANLAVAFQQLRFKTLVVELDPQGSLIRVFGLDRFDLHHGLFGVLTGQGTLEEAIETGLMDELHLLPANVWSHEEEIRYLDAFTQDPLALRQCLTPLRASYDYILIDCPPGLGATTLAALAACDRYLVPVQAEAMNLESLPRLEQTADTVRKSLNPELTLDGYVVTMADARTRHACDVIQTLINKYPRSLLETVIPRSIRVAEECAKGRPTVAGAPATRVGRAFVSLSEEILSRHARSQYQGGEDLPDADTEAESEGSSEEEVWGLPADLPDFEEAAVPVSGNGRAHGGFEAGEREPEGEWNDHEDYLRE